MRVPRPPLPVKLHPLRWGDPPPGPTQPDFWRSPLRGPWLTSLLGLILLVAIPVIAITGYLSYAAYNPELGRNNLIGQPGFLDFYLFDWPTRPSWLYSLNQGVHVTLGITVFPILLAKLWSVIPKLFEWPPARSVSHALERLSLALLVGGALFEFVTGIFNAQLYYPWKFSFLSAHYYGAWVFSGAFLLHASLKLPTARRSMRQRRLIDELRTNLDATEPEDRDAAAAEEGHNPEASLVAVAPARATISRRGLLGVVGAASGSLLVLTAGQSAGGPFRRLAWLSPHGRDLGEGPNDFQINKTARAVGIEPNSTGPSWRLAVKGPQEASLSRKDLLAMPQYTHDLPIACVEGWSTTQKWTGVRLRDLAQRVGAEHFDELFVRSLQKRGSFSKASLSPDQVDDERSLLALKVNGADLSLDHGFPARVIVPALPGVHCTKWVAQMEFRSA